MTKMLEDLPQQQLVDDIRNTVSRLKVFIEEAMRRNIDVKFDLHPSKTRANKLDMTCEINKRVPL